MNPSSREMMTPMPRLLRLCCLKPSYAAFLALLLTALLLPACSEKKKPPPPAVPVLAATVTERTVPVELKVIGNVEAYATVNIKARVGGQITQVNFREGQDVEKGQILFV